MSTINEQHGLATASAGTISATIFCLESILGHLYVKAETPSTTFDFKLTDINGNEILKRLDNDGELNELIRMPAKHNYTMTIYNTSVDEGLAYSLNFIE